MKASIRILTLFSTVLNLCLLTPARGQTANLITCSTERNADNSISLFADSRVFGEYTLRLNFPVLTGYKASGISVYNNQAMTIVTRGKKEIARLTPDKSAANYSYSYSYAYFPGAALRRLPDTNFLYILPGSAGNTLRVSQVVNLYAQLGQNTSPDFFSTGFTYQLGDTICASRGGVVYDCVDAVQEGEKNTEVFKGDRNRIQVQHKDGTLGHYVMRAPIQLLVTPGDEVIAGQPLAVFTKKSEHYTVMLSVNYLDEKKLMSADKDLGIVKVYVSYLHPVFCTNSDGAPGPALVTNTNFTVTHPRQVISAEMSKKEKKKYGYQ